MGRPADLILRGGFSQQNQKKKDKRPSHPEKWGVRASCCKIPFRGRGEGLQRVLGALPGTGGILGDISAGPAGSVQYGTSVAGAAPR